MFDEDYLNRLKRRQLLSGFDKFEGFNPKFQPGIMTPPPDPNAIPEEEKNEIDLDLLMQEADNGVALNQYKEHLANTPEYTNPGKKTQIASIIAAGLDGYFTGGKNNVPSWGRMAFERDLGDHSRKAAQLGTLAGMEQKRFGDKLNVAKEDRNERKQDAAMKYQMARQEAADARLELDKAKANNATNIALMRLEESARQADNRAEIALRVIASRENGRPDNSGNVTQVTANDPVTGQSIIYNVNKKGEKVGVFGQAKLSDRAVEEQSEIRTLVRESEDLMKLIKKHPGAIGFFDGTVKAPLARYTNLAPAAYHQIYTKGQNILNIDLKRFSGSAVRDSELARIKKVIGSPTSSEESYLQAMVDFNKLMKDIASDRGFTLENASSTPGVEGAVTGKRVVK